MALITKDLNSGLTADQLAQFIIGDSGSVVAGSVKFTGDNRAVGTFGGGISEQINVEAGVIFSTGDIASANGPNKSDSTSTTFNTAGDADLNVLIAATGFTTNDAAVLEFDFIPKQNEFALEYVFASEEYNEYVNKFNDVFGFFVNGVNTPLVPGTTQPVSIDTINSTINTAFYFNNDPSDLGIPTYKTAFDGFTAVLTAQGAVIPNVPNRLKLAIADTKDFALDSAVFISALPLFNFSQPTYEVNEDGTVVGATITINRSGITNATSNVDVNFSNGSATGGATLGLGVDFVFTTQTVNFAADQTTATISVPINNDSLVEPTENLTLTLANPQNGIIGITQNTANLDILTDNDTAGIIITSTAGADVAEGGTSDTYTVVLQSQPSDLVIVTVDPDTQTDLGSGTGVPLTLNFTPNNWNVPQTVTIEAVDDQVAEASPHTSAIAHTASSVDPNYDGAAVPITVDGTATATLTANVTDNDTPSVKITETGGSTNIGEGGATDSYTAVLTTKPAADVTVTASPDAQSDVGIGGGIPIALKFTPDNWNVPQLVNVQAVDDGVAQGTHSSTIAHQVTSTDAKYNLIATASVTAQITDNDTAGVTITPASTTATEGDATGSYKVALTSKPTAPVNVNFNTGIQIDSISTFTFTLDNWNLPQIVTVKATDDSLVEGLHTGTIDHSIAAGSAAEYLPVAIAPVTVSITDNDVATPNTPSITITPASTTAAEGGATGSYEVSLNTQPTANVTVNVAAGSQINAIAPLVFTPANWNVPQTVTVTATDDTVVEGAHSGTINHSVAGGSAAEYLPVAIAPVSVTIADNDTATSTAGVKITPTTTYAAEGGANGSYSAVLTEQPSSDVKVSFATDSQIEAIASFTFTSDNWNLPQTATVKATDDSAVEGTHLSTIAASASSTDLAYNNIGISPVDVLIIDNDSPGIAVTPNSTNAAEGGAAGSYNIVLTKAPTANVTVNFAAGSQIDAIAPITFTPANWDAPQTVTVTATDDTVVEGGHSGTIDHSVAPGSAAEYLAVAIAPVTVTIADNDTATNAPAGVTVTQTGGSTIVAEGGATDTYQVALNSQPKSDVKVSFATDSQIEAIASFTFTVANWNLPQTATVKATDDSAVEGTHLSTIAASASSTDLAYNNIGIPKVDVLILDNDIPGIAVTPNSTNAAENGAAGSYSIVLTKAPTANVTVNFTAGSQIDAIAPITFTPANWDAPQTVTVTATDDSIVEGTHTGFILSSVASGSAAEYLPVAIAPVSVTIADNDTATSTAGVKITPTTTYAAEGGANGSYSAVLTEQPSSDVKVSFATDSQIEAIASFTFTSDNWNLPQTATVKATDDSAVEGTHLSTIAASASSTDLAYNNIGISPVDVLIIDNDSPGIAVTPNSTNAAEGGVAGSYSIVLTKAPTANVTVNFTAGSQIDAIAPITFTPANWDAPQTVTVTATDDTVVEGGHSGFILSSVAPGSAAEYLPVAIAPVSVTIADNDIAPPTPTPVINFSPTIIVPPTPTPAPTPAPVINFSPTIIVPPTPTPAPTPAPVINFSPTIIVPPTPTPAPVINFSPTIIVPPTPTPAPTPAPTPIPEPTPVPTLPPTEDPDCICAQITLPEISPLHGFNLVQNNLAGADTNDILTGTSGGDGINGLAGDDVLVGLAGNDNLFGGLMSNIPVGPQVDRDLLLGGPGDDYLNGQAGYDTVFGGKGNDAAFGGKDNDLIWGGRGSDTVVGEEGNDSLYGGTNSESDRDRAGNDLLFGAKGNDFLSGQDASDTLSGGDGNDTARGGKGNDVLLGDSGSDLLFGDQGNDSICGGEGDDTVFGDIGSPLPVGVAGGQDQVCGGAGNDLLFGNEGSDTINGDAGDDTILGGKDSDSLVGGAGDDVLIGDEGSDTLLGGSGRDLFVLTSGQGSDVISDFRKGEDLLSLAGGLTFTQLSISQGTDGQEASPTTFIRISNSGELLAVLNGVQASAIAPSDFVQILRLGS